MNEAVMLDLETMGNAPGCAIVAIGAVWFHRALGVAEDSPRRFYRRVDLASCLAAGLTMDASTVLWWLQQSETARMELQEPADPLPVVLRDFREWLAGGPFDLRQVEVWGNGAAFDNAVLAAAYRALRMETPWRFWNDRCYRTLKAMRPDVPLAKRTGTHHNALDDAITQAEHLVAILQSSNPNAEVRRAS